MNLIALAAVVAGALGPGPADSLEVTVAESAIEVPASVQAGRVPVTVTNGGRGEHDLVVVRTDLAPDELPVGLSGVSAQAAGQVVLGREHGEHAHGVGADDRHLDAGATRRRTLRLEPGRYVAFCPLPGHYERGQRAAFTVS